MIVALAATALAGGLTGCATSGTTEVGAPAAPATVPATTGPSPCPSGHAGDVRTVTEAASGSTVCLAVGEHLEVYLHGTQADTWSSIGLDGRALSAEANGKGTLVIGVTAGFYVARADGDAHLTSSRAACPTPTPATPSCGGTRFALTIIVG
jgi:hypothetical protein